jgi:hypothetical protein
MTPLRHAFVPMFAIATLVLLAATPAVAQSSSANEEGRLAALKRIARFVPSAYDLRQVYNAGQPGGEGGSTATANRRIEIRAVHKWTIRTGIAAVIYDGNGLRVPFARLHVLVRNTTDLGPDAPTFADENLTQSIGGPLNVPWFSGTTVTANAAGLGNLTDLTIAWCGRAITRFEIVLCPLPSTLEAAPDSVLVCAEKVTVVLSPDPLVVQLRFRSLTDPTATGATGVAGGIVHPFVVELQTSCRTPMRLIERTDLNSTTDASDQRPPSLGEITVNGIGLTGTVTQRVTTTAEVTLATFTGVQAVLLPGASSVAFDQPVPSTPVTANVTFIAGRLVALSLAASLSLEVTIAPSSAQVRLATWLIALDGSRRDAFEKLVADFKASSGSAVGSLGLNVTDVDPLQASSRAFGLPVTDSELFSPDTIARISRSAYAVDLNVIRKLSGAMYAFVFNASVFAATGTLNQQLPPELYASAANGTLHCRADFSMDNAPRGLTYGLTQGGFITALPRFAVSTTVDGVARQLFVLPFIVGPLGSLSSTLTETLSCNLNPALFAQHYHPGDVGFQLEVAGLDDKAEGLARRFLSVFAILNPDVAFISVVIQVCDCSIDNGLELDVALHPLQFPIGTNQLTRYLIGALVGNALLVTIIAAVSFGLSKLWLKQAGEIIVDGPDLVPVIYRTQQAANAALLRKEALEHRSHLVFPHAVLITVTALYPGTTFAAYALLPFVMSNTFVVVAWCLVGIVFACVYPLFVIRVATKLSPTFQDLDVHSITRGWVWKVLIPLGDYESGHADATRFRHCFEDFRGRYRWFLGVLLASWLVLSIFAAKFVACSSRFILPLTMQIGFFFFYVARAPYITAYRNVLAVVSSIMICVGLGFLFWDGMERRSTTFLSAWSVALSLLSVVVTVTRFVFARFYNRYNIAAARGHLDEEFLVIEEDESRKARRNGYYDATGKFFVDASGRGAADDEFVDAGREAAEMDTSGLRVTVYDPHATVKRSVFADVEFESPDGAYRYEAKKPSTLAGLLDEILDGKPPDVAASARALPLQKSQLTHDEFRDWVDQMSRRERYEADLAASRELRGRSQSYRASVERPQRRLTVREVAELKQSPEERRRQENERIDRTIEEQFRRLSAPTASPSLEYGRRFAPGRVFGYQRRLEEVARGCRDRGALRPEDADDGLDGEEATNVVGADSAMLQRARDRMKAVLRKPVMPPRNLSASFEALWKRKTRSGLEPDADL